MPAKFEDILTDLKANKFKPLYFLAGDEPFFIDQVANYIEEHALSPGERGFNQSVLYGLDTNLKSVLGQARQFPMMAQKRVIVVKEAQNLSEISRKEGQELLQKYAEKPVESTVLVFCYKGKRLDGKTKLYGAIDKNAVYLDSKKLYDNQLPDWIVRYGQEIGIKIQARAAYIMAESIGNDLSRIAKELDKLLIVVPKGQEIDERLVTDNIGVSKEFNTFELQNALGKKQVLKANQIIQYFASNPKNNPLIPIVASLYSFFSKILHYHCLENKQEATIALKIPPFIVAEYASAAKNYPLPKCLIILQMLAEVDLKSKGIDSSADESELLKELVFGILH